MGKMKDLEVYMLLPYGIEVVLEECTDGTTCYRASHPELPGCMSHGDFPDEALANLGEARQLYIADLLERGLAVPIPASSSMSASSTATSKIWVSLDDVALKNDNVCESTLPERAEPLHVPA